MVFQLKILQNASSENRSWLSGIKMQHCVCEQRIKQLCSNTRHDNDCSRPVYCRHLAAIHCYCCFVWTGPNPAFWPNDQYTWIKERIWPEEIIYIICLFNKIIRDRQYTSRGNQEIFLQYWSVTWSMGMSGACVYVPSQQLSRLHSKKKSTSEHLFGASDCHK